MLYQLSHFRPVSIVRRWFGAESQIRTGDTAIFSRVLYQLSYLGPPVRSPYSTTSQCSPARDWTPAESSSGWPVMRRSRLTRSTTGGCVLNRLPAVESSFLTGLTM
jgi:hypothetical protein